MINEGTGGRVRPGIRQIWVAKRVPQTVIRTDGSWASPLARIGHCWVGGEERDIISIQYWRTVLMALPIWALYATNKVYADKSLGYDQTERFKLPRVSTLRTVVKDRFDYADEAHRWRPVQVSTGAMNTIICLGATTAGSKTCEKLAWTTDEIYPSVRFLSISPLRKDFKTVALPQR